MRITLILPLIQVQYYYFTGKAKVLYSTFFWVLLNFLGSMPPNNKVVSVAVPLHKVVTATLLLHKALSATLPLHKVLSPIF